MPSLFLLTIFPLLALGAIFATLYWWQTLVTVLKHEPTTDHQRLTWVIILLSLQFPGALLYRYARRRTPSATRAAKFEQDGLLLY